MAIFDVGSVGEESDDEMARAPINLQAVASGVRDLKNAGLDREAFDRVVSGLLANVDLRAPDFVAIAEKYAVPLRRPTTKKAALEAISKRYAELARSRKRNEIAAKSRPY